MKITVYGNGKLTVEETKYPICSNDEALFKVKACGICGSDVARVFNQAAYYYPIILGHEFAGVVEKSSLKRHMHSK